MLLRYKFNNNYSHVNTFNNINKTSKILLNFYFFLFIIRYVFFKNLKIRSLKFFNIKKKKKIITLLKSPMAHKTWSKEQIYYSYNTFIVSINIYFKKIYKMKSFIYYFFILNNNLTDISFNLLRLKHIVLKVTFFKKLK